LFCLKVEKKNTIIMSSSANDWKAYYETDFDMAELNIQMEKVLALCDFKNSDEECVKNLKENSGLAILIVDSFNEIHLFHQVHFLGPNLLFPSERIMALSGQTFPAPCFRLNSDYMFANIEVPVPDWNQLKSADSIESGKSSIAEMQKCFGSPSSGHRKHNGFKIHGPDKIASQFGKRY